MNQSCLSSDPSPIALQMPRNRYRACTQFPQLIRSVGGSSGTRTHLGRSKKDLSSGSPCTPSYIRPSRGRQHHRQRHPDRRRRRYPTHLPPPSIKKTFTSSPCLCLPAHRLRLQPLHLSFTIEISPVDSMFRSAAAFVGARRSASACDDLCMLPPRPALPVTHVTQPSSYPSPLLLAHLLCRIANLMRGV